ncbi:MAG: Ala-tRNA(Pro) hydrolase [Candidatus Cloacimonas sp. SDB]|nr:MAG: Ala-tRNA(Pro) hydrolase [Candidatus Cloacimonas sp. SDB]
MSKLLYLEDSYLKKFQARVIKVNYENKYIVLDRTAFYPAGGGQPCDFGTIEFDGITSNITMVKRIEEEICHYLDGVIPEIDSSITGILDWERRYNLMRTHTALHIMSAVVWRDYQVLVTGGNMEPLSGRLDFEFEHLTQQIVTEIEEKVNTEIAQGKIVSSRTISREEANKIPDLIRTKVNLLPDSLKQIRVVEIEGLDLQADGGTHVNNTSEIGKFRIVKFKSKGKINKRIKIEIF